MFGRPAQVNARQVRRVSYDGPMIVSRLIAASPDALYAAWMNGEAVARWLPPEGMSGHMHRFEPWEGGGYRMTLAYDAPSGGRGKSSADADVVEVRFVELVPARRIVQAVDFQAADPAYGGTMTLTWSFARADGGTLVKVEVQNPPPGVRDEDHEAGIRSSLDNLAEFVSGP